jgi:hypothetical protein
VVLEERPAGRRGRLSAPWHVLRTVETATSMPRLRQLVSDAGRAPGHVRLRHLADELHDLAVRAWATQASRALPRPKPPEPFPASPDHGRGLDDGEGFPPTRPPLREGHPKGSVPRP